MISAIDALRAHSQKSGISRSFDPGVLAARAMVQYTRDHVDIRGVLQDYGEFNSIYVVNNSAVAIAVDLDFTTSKRIPVPAYTSLGKDQVTFLEFNVTNLDAANATAAGQVTVLAMNERPLVREGR